MSPTTSSISRVYNGDRVSMALTARIFVIARIKYARKLYIVRVTRRTRKMTTASISSLTMTATEM